MALTPQAFADQHADRDAFMVNVHEPAGATIAGTDAAIAYDQIAGDDRLPAGRDAPILLYCQTGGMSLTAGRALIADGYRNVSNLEGGMEAWERAGFELGGS